MDFLRRAAEAATHAADQAADRMTGAVARMRGDAPPEADGADDTEIFWREKDMDEMTQTQAQIQTPPAEPQTPAEPPAQAPQAPWTPPATPAPAEIPSLGQTQAPPAPAPAPAPAPSPAPVQAPAAPSPSLDALLYRLDVPHLRAEAIELLASAPRGPAGRAALLEAVGVIETELDLMGARQ